MANQHSFDMSVLAAGELTDMITAMVKHPEETEDRWDEVVDTAKTYSPDDPEDGSLLKDWSNVVHIKGVVNDIMSAVNQYNFPNSSPQYDNPYLSHLSQTFSSTSTDSTTEVELDDLEDGSAHSGVNHSPNGKRHCHTCGKTDQWHTPQDCPAAFRIEDNRMSIMGYLLLGSVFT